MPTGVPRQAARAPVWMPPGGVSPTRPLAKLRAKKIIRHAGRVREGIVDSLVGVIGNNNSEVGRGSLRAPGGAMNHDVFDSSDGLKLQKLPPIILPDYPAQSTHCLCQGTQPHRLSLSAFFFRAQRTDRPETPTQTTTGGAQRSRSAPRTKKEKHGWPDTPRRALRYVRSWPAPEALLQIPSGLDADFAINIIRNLCAPP